MLKQGLEGEKEKMENYYKFIIKTDSYAGNFEREMCAYVTGLWDGETHGKDQAKIFSKELNLNEDKYGEDNPFYTYMMMVPLEHDNISYISYVNIGGYKNQDIFLFFEKKPTPDLIDLMKKRAYKFSKEGLIFDRPVHFKILGFELVKVITMEEKIKI